MELVPIQPEHYEFVRWLRNHPASQEGFLVKVGKLVDDRGDLTIVDEITPEQQQVYMAEYSDHYHVCMGDVGGYYLPLGYIGVLDGDIRVCTRPSLVGRGIGSFMLRGILEHYPNAVGRIKRGNYASIKLFKRCGVPYQVI